MKNDGKKLFVYSVFALLFVFQSCRDPQAGAWPQFRGINAAGIAAADARPPLTVDEEHLLWKTEIPSGHSSPCVMGDDIFVTGCSESDSSLHMLCVDRKSGKVRWDRALFPESFEKVHAVGNAAQPSPVTDGERVYFYFGSYGLLCYTTDGEPVWEMPLPLTEAGYGVASSPVLYGDLLLLNRDVRSEQRMLALNRYSGDTVWVSDLPAGMPGTSVASYSTPIIWKEQIVLHRYMQIAALSVSDGSLLWKMNMPTNGNSTPVADDDLLYFEAWQEMSEQEQRGEMPDFRTMLSRYDHDANGLISREEIPDEMILFHRPEIEDLQKPIYLRNFFGRFDTDGNGFSDSLEWADATAFIRSYYTEGGLIAVRPDTTGELAPDAMVWKVRDKIPEVPSPLLYGGLVYMCKNGGILTCVDAAGGQICYQERLGAAGAYMASPVAANGYLYFVSVNGKLTVVEAGRDYKKVAESKTEGKIFATPAIIGNTLYLRTTSALMAFR